MEKVHNIIPLNSAAMARLWGSTLNNSMPLYAIPLKTIYEMIQQEQIVVPNGL